MQAVLKNLHSVPGVIGGLLSNNSGKIMAHSFPDNYDQDTLNEITSNLFDNIEGLREATGGARLLDLRYAMGRIVIKKISNLLLVLLCEKDLNIQLLTLSANVAGKKLEKIAQDMQPTPADAIPLHSSVVPASSVPTGIRTDSKGIILTTETMKKTASTFWDSMIEEATINRETASAICNHFNIPPFDRLILHNRQTDSSANVPIKTIQRDKDGNYDGKIIVTLALAEKLKVSSGEQLVAEAIIGGGLFGWEGI